jgi:hypothetical protein
MRMCGAATPTYVTTSKFNEVCCIPNITAYERLTRLPLYVVTSSGRLNGTWRSEWQTCMHPCERDGEPLTDKLKPAGGMRRGVDPVRPVYPGWDSRTTWRVAKAACTHSEQEYKPHAVRQGHSSRMRVSVDWCKPRGLVAVMPSGHTRGTPGRAHQVNTRWKRETAELCRYRREACHVLP